MILNIFCYISCRLNRGAIPRDGKIAQPSGFPPSPVSNGACLGFLKTGWVWVVNKKLMWDWGFGVLC